MFSKFKLLQPKSKAITKTIIFACLIVIVAGYFIYTKLYNKADEAAMAADAGAPVEVNVIQISKREEERFIDLPARVAASKIAEVRPQINGVIKEHKFVEGSFVKKGQQLYQIDPAFYQSAVNSASANYKTLLAKKNRYQNLLELGGVSKQEFEDVVAAFSSAEADLKRAKTNISYTKVYAPISGYIGKSNVTEGALATANQEQVLVTITHLDPIYVDMVQPTQDALKLGDLKGIPVDVITEDPNYKNTGVLKFTEVFADESTDSVRLRAVFSNKDKKLLPGMFVNARLHLKQKEMTTVPQRATNRMPDGSLSVFVVDEGNTIKTRIIKAEEIIGNSWIVTEGLNEGDIVVYEGFQKISDGAKVNPILIRPLDNSEANAA